MNRLTTYLLPAGTTLGILAGGYILWEYGRYSSRRRTTSFGLEHLFKSDSPMRATIRGDVITEEDVAITQRERVGNTVEDATLLRQYDWNVYMKLPPTVATLYESTLLGDLLSGNGVKLKDEDVSRLLSENTDLRNSLLECWKRGNFDMLRQCDVVLGISKGAGRASKYLETGIAIPSVEIYGGNFKNIGGDNLEITYSSDHHKTVAEWYSPIDYRLTHHDISKKRTENTGIWLIDSEPFNKWRTDPSRRVLWCPGIPGVGKTTIASLVIDYLRQQRSETIAVGFAYFNYKLQGRQSTTMVLECLARQIYEAYQGTASSTYLEDLYTINQKDYPRPPSADLFGALSTTCQQFQQYYIVLDALDEYLENYNIEGVLELLTTLVSLGDMVKLLVTSRVLDGMEGLFLEFDAIREDIKANNEDMTTYLRSRIGTAGFRFEISRSLLEEIVEKVKEAAGGRFLMAEFHMNTLAEQLNRGSLKDALADLPHGIDATYERVLQRIKTYPKSHMELAIMTLTWVACSKRRLSVGELQHALAIRPGLRSIGDYVTSMPTITSLCAGLVTVRDERVIFVHFTAQDFFDNPRIRAEYFPTAEGSMLSRCIAYLSLPLCIDVCQRYSWRLISHRIPFYDYAVMHLGFHSQSLPEGASEDLDALLTSNHEVARLFSIHLNRFLPEDDVLAPSAVFLAIYYDRAAVLPSLLTALEKIPLTVLHRTPLAYAARSGKLACVEAMVAWYKAHLDTTDSQSSAASLEGVPEAGEPFFVTQAAAGDPDRRFLATHDSVNPNLPDSDGRTPLNHAVANNHEGVVALLLACDGINVNMADNQGRTPLIHAAMRCNKLVVAHLVNFRGVDINPSDNNGRTPISYAAACGDKELVSLLLGCNGVQTNWADSKGRSPLNHAATLGHKAVVTLLIACNGIDVNLADKEGRTPLNRAAAHGHKAVVTLLVGCNNIDVNLADRRGRTPLSHAVEGGYEAIVNVLLCRQGINVNSAELDGWTPLIWAVQAGRLGVVELLLRNEDVDVNLAESDGWTPLIWAAQAGQEEVTKLLLGHHDVNVNWEDVEGRTALSHAAEHGYEAVVNLLLTHKAIDINLAETDGWTPLIWAAQAGKERVVELLLNHGSIDINLTDVEGRTALSRAAEKGYGSVVAHLLRHKAVNVNLGDKSGWTPLFWASSRYQEAVVKKLLDYPGIDMNRQDRKGATALSQAIAKREGATKAFGLDAAKPIIRLLLSQEGLDANIVDDSGQGPFSHAQKRLLDDQRWEEVCNLLRGRGAVEGLES